jgi:hypothetical protein
VRRSARQARWVAAQESPSKFAANSPVLLRAGGSARGTVGAQEQRGVARTQASDWASVGPGHLGAMPLGPMQAVNALSRVDTASKLDGRTATKLEMALPDAQAVSSAAGKENKEPCSLAGEAHGTPTEERALGPEALPELAAVVKEMIREAAALAAEQAAAAEELAGRLGCADTCVAPPPAYHKGVDAEAEVQGGAEAAAAAATGLGAGAGEAPSRAPSAPGEAGYDGGCDDEGCASDPPPPGTKRTRRVSSPVLSRHAASLSPY